MKNYTVKFINKINNKIVFEKNYDNTEHYPLSNAIYTCVKEKISLSNIEFSKSIYFDNEIVQNKKEEKIFDLFSIFCLCLKNVDFSCSDFSDISIHKTYFNECCFDMTNFNNTNIDFSNFEKSILTNITKFNAVINGIVFMNDVDLNKSYFNLVKNNYKIIGSFMMYLYTRNKNSFNILFKHYSAVNNYEKTFKAACKKKINLNGVDAANCTLNNIDMSNIDIISACFSNSSLKDINFNNSNLNGSNFDHANITNCFFDQSNLQWSSFIGSRIVGTSFNTAHTNGIRI